jgi:hypothetical protein
MTWSRRSVPSFDSIWARKLKAFYMIFKNTQDNGND